jgi:nitroimidazol reductase NimA-like FMN-containing flavoprotein (pyridoxamine 5'-phosphate oxidase superfamily)
MHLLLFLVVYKMELSKTDIEFIRQLPVCRLATTTKNCEPIVRPVWHVFNGETVYFASDTGKPKLEQIKNNPCVSIVFDDYDKNNWSKLMGIRMQGNAELLWKGKEYRYAHYLLKNKYPEYRTLQGGWREGELPIIKITPKRFSRWSSEN